jgi:hypothetical protein
MGITKGPDGMYHVKGKAYPFLVGSRQQVGHGTAYKTTGGLTADCLFYNKHGRWVSKVKHDSEKKNKRLEKAGFFTKKGVFGWDKHDKKGASRTRRTRKH